VKLHDHVTKAHATKVQTTKTRMAKVFCGLLTGLVLTGIAPAAMAQTEIQWWHSLSGPLGEKLGELATKFNASQNVYKVVPTYKGNYNESMTALLAAFPKGEAPHIVQVLEVGTATMMASRKMVVPVSKLMLDANEPFSTGLYIPAVSGYYMDDKGTMYSFPFNSSTPLLYVNKDAFRKAGLDPNTPPKTWKDFAAAAAKLKTAGSTCVYSTSWPSWIHIENFSAWHNVPMGTKDNGMAGADTQFTFNSPLHVRHVEMLADMAKKGQFTYANRTNGADAKFSSGECAMVTASSSALAGIRRNAKFEWSANFLPYHQEAAGAPRNSIIGGASLWVIAGKTNNAYKGVAQFFTFLSRPDIQAEFHQGTGYMPITTAAYDKTRMAGFYDKNPGSDTPVRQISNRRPSSNSKGVRFGNLVEGREVIEEELEQAFSGKKSAKAALDSAVTRGNEILKKFKAANS
jgi:sn-glycerol 3-phosphate transport system substrate-binding protein